MPLQIDRSRFDTCVDHLATALFYATYKQKWRLPTTVVSPNFFSSIASDQIVPHQPTLDAVEISRNVLQQGLVDATVVPVPLDLQARKLGLNVLARAYEIFTYPEGGLVTTTKKIKEKPDEIKRTIRAGIKASRYVRANRDGTIQFLMEWQKIDREIATATYEYLSRAINDDGSLPENGFRLLIEEVKELANVSREVSLSDVADLSILREAQKELGIKGK